MAKYSIPAGRMFSIVRKFAKQKVKHMPFSIISVDNWSHSAIDSDAA
jgi:hypothetical protein